MKKLSRFRKCLISSGLLLSILLMLSPVCRAEAAAQLSCRTKIAEGAPGAQASQLPPVTCGTGEVLVTADIISSDGKIQCNTNSYQTPEGLAFNGGCGSLNDRYWMTRLTCCRVSAMEARRLSCKRERVLGGLGKPVPPAWRRLCCQQGSAVTVQSYLYQTGGGNCPVRLVEDDGRNCAAIFDCGRPPELAEWVVEMACCSVTEAER